MKEERNKYQDRRDFLKKAGKWIIAFPLGYLAFSLVKKTSATFYVWQIDPLKCNQCGQCETHCVLTPSAVKCVHAYEICGYCDICSGYLRQGVKNINTGAENQLCPTGAITRRFIEEPFFEYTIDEDLCNGCSKCVKGCSDFGNGSLYLQINHDLCENCNECSIARDCPSDAISRVPSSSPYILKEGFAT